MYRRYLTRHRTHRLVGGLLGVLLALVLGIRAYGEVRIGVGGGSPLADVLFCRLAGVLVGAFSAEAFRLSQPASATVSASLAARPEVVPRTLVRRARLLVGVALGLAVAVAALGGREGSPGAGGAAVGVALGGVALVGVAELTLAALPALLQLVVVVVTLVLTVVLLSRAAPRPPSGWPGAAVVAAPA